MVSVDGEEEKWIKHYSNFHKILLVGEGDFSFSACLAKAFGSASNMVATSLDSEETLAKKHWTAEANLQDLRDYGCTIVHGVDASTMSQHPLLTLKSFDRIVFNFPHSGLILHESDPLQILWHQRVVEGFMSSARDMLNENGEVHTTHKTSYPYTEWEIEKLAEEAGLYLVEEVPFTKWDYPGYHNKKGYGHKSNKTFRVGECSTFKFSML